MRTDFDYDAWLSRVQAKSATPAVNLNSRDPERNVHPTKEQIHLAEPESRRTVEIQQKVGRPSSSLLARERPWHFRGVPKRSDALEEELAPIRKSFAKFQATRKRDGVYIYLRAVFKLVKMWKQRGMCRSRVARISTDHPNAGSSGREPYTVVIQATSDVDAKTRSKWSRALRYVERANVDDEYLPGFIKQNGGINECAAGFATRRHRARKKR